MQFFLYNLNIYAFDMTLL